MVVTGHFLGKGDVGGPFGWIAVLFLTLYVGAIAAALLWFPLLAISQLIQRPRPKQWWMGLVLPIAAFVCAAPIPLKEVAKWWAARRVEHQVTIALDAPGGTPQAWAGIDTASNKVIGQVVVWLSNHPAASSEKLQEIADVFSQGPGVATMLASHARCSLSLLQALWDRSPRWRKGNDLRNFEQAIVRHPACGEALHWQILREAEYSETRDAILELRGASNPALYQEYFRVCADCRYLDPRVAIAKDRRLPLSLMPQLARDRDFHVRAALTRNPMLPFELLEQLNADPALEVRHAVIQRTNAPPEWRTSFYLEAIDSADPNIRRIAPEEDENISEASLDKLAQDPVSYVRLTVARNRKTPRRLLESLSRDPDSYVQSEARRHLNE